ncbi:hypothetical protein D5018_06230 [Parashewanella curva]|uniref:Tetratricopeptide repeat protein n=1 Tax=Parashewanella curva TaxID=2338552 RepID=A0A3L8Q2F7_9GAMM|nr:hypothetical protein [Parashewanella curva]RLV60542.1 hypothetical protein D5018_06230 [Parashewanella curva]
MKRVLVCLALCFSISGCATSSLFVSYPSQLQTQKQALNSSQPDSQLPQLTGNISSNDGLLYAQEAGRVAQISGNFAESKKYYQQAIEKYLAFDNKAVVSASDIGANASSLLLNDNTIPYEGSGFERIMLHQYQAFNYLFEHDFEGALVEVRRANELQQIQQDKYESSKKSVQRIANGVVSDQEEKLRQGTGSVTSSFLNAYSYYVTGLLHEILGRANDAFIDYRKAAAIWPHNPFVEQSLVRLAKQLSMPQYSEFRRKFGEPKLPKSNQGELIVIYEKGFVQPKGHFSVPFTVKGNWQTIDLPTYYQAATYPGSANISGLPTEPLRAASITSIDALAMNALREDLPFILTRQAARVYAKAELARHITGRHQQNNDVFDLGSLAVQVFNVVTEQADRRSWLTLPNQAQIARKYVQAGTYPISVEQSQTQNTTIEAGRKTLVWVVKTGNYVRFYSILI